MIPSDKISRNLSLSLDRIVNATSAEDCDVTLDSLLAEAARPQTFVHKAAQAAMDSRCDDLIGELYEQDGEIAAAKKGFVAYFQGYINNLGSPSIFLDYHMRGMIISMVKLRAILM